MDLGLVQQCGESRWRNSRAKKRLVGVDVADTRDERLIEENTLDRASRAFDCSRKCGRRYRKRVWSKLGPSLVQRGARWKVPQSTKPARIAKYEFGSRSIGQLQQPLGVLVVLLSHQTIRLGQRQLTGHSEVYAKHGTVVGHERELFSMALNRGDVPVEEQGVARRESRTHRASIKNV